MFAATLAHGAEWQTDYEQALSTAKTSKKFVLLSFMGSDWCGPCIVLHKTALVKPAFMEYAQKNLVLVDVDFPKRKKLEEKLSQQNSRLMKQYQVDQLPTLILLNPDGQTVARLEGYSGEGPADIVAWAEKGSKTQ
jgi:thiol-disulfide isomerase/thioredoxin